MAKVSTLRYYSIAGMRVAKADDTNTLEYFITDLLGSTVMVLDALMDGTGDIISQQCYLPFGEVRIDVGTPITQTDFGFTGQRISRFLAICNLTQLTAQMSKTQHSGLCRGSGRTHAPSGRLIQPLFGLSIV